MNAIIEAIGVEGEVAAICAKNPQMVVFRYPRILCNEQRDSIRESWKRIAQGTSLEHVNVLILDNGMDMAIVEHVEDQ